MECKQLENNLWKLNKMFIDFEYVKYYVIENHGKILRKHVLKSVGSMKGGIITWLKKKLLEKRKAQ